MSLYIRLFWLWIMMLAITAAARRKKARGPTNLLHSLMRDYSTLFRPNIGANATQVNVDIDLQDVVRLEEGTLEARVIFVAWLKVNWTDRRLAWDPDYYGIRDIRLDPRKLWIPDVKLINSLDPSINRDWSIMLMVSFNGMVRGIMPVHLPVHCGRPRDPHASWECKLLFRSWTYTVDDLDLRLANNTSDVSRYNDRVWRITGNEAKRSVVRTDCCPERFAELTYTIKLIRH